MHTTRLIRSLYIVHRRDPTKTTKLRSFQCRRSIKKRVFRKARKGKWNKFVNSLNSRTQTKKVWDKFRKVNGNYKPRTILLLEKGGSIITSPDEIADTFADHYSNISRDPHKKTKPKNSERGRKKKSYHIINYSQTENWKRP